MATYMKNFSYIFIPFALEDADRFGDFYRSLQSDDGWEQVDDEIRYLHRYVSDKLVTQPDGTVNAFRFRLKEDCTQAQSVQLGSGLYRTGAKKFRGESVRFEFTVANAQLFAFNTSVCMLAFQLQFTNDDPFHIAAAEYHLRKITTEKIHPADGEAVSFVDISRKVLQRQAAKFKLDFFFYAAPRNERANFLTYIDVPRQADYDRELFYLKWCYNDEFEYDTTSCEDGSENYIAAASTVWGVSPSAAVCLVNRDGKERQFLENVFQKNFQKQYLMTYVLLLHQKYTMYLFLTKLCIDIEGKLAELENYKRRLYMFETRYMFSQISEVPQYQRFYTKVKQAFAMDDMFHDVQEPLAQLAEMQQQALDKAQQADEKRLNATLTILSFLTVVSALTDAGGIAADLGWLLPPLAAKILQCVALTFVVGLTVYLICRLISLKKKR